jgi:hypothetical protein
MGEGWTADVDGTDYCPPCASQGLAGTSILTKSPGPKSPATIAVSVPLNDNRQMILDSASSDVQAMLTGLRSLRDQAKTALASGLSDAAAKGLAKSLVALAGRYLND